jgi:hypothetical protein
MKLTLFLSLLILTFSTSAFARDSLWSLCLGDVEIFQEKTKLVVNVYEHRKDLGRETNLTLIFGGHTLEGSFDSTESDRAKIILKNTQSSIFRGFAKIDYAVHTITLDGILDLAESTTVHAKLKCKTLRD